MLRVDSTRLIRRLNELARVGATADGGVTRIAFSDADVEARKIIAARMVEAGLQIRSDAIGNTIGRLNGTQPDRPSIVVGSHTDTIPNGGKYDGALGVVAAIECACIHWTSWRVAEPC